MALSRDLSDAQLSFEMEGVAADQFPVIRFRGQEGLCQLYRFEIDLASADPSADMESFVGKAALLTVNVAGEPRWFHGIVSRFEQTGQTADQTHYRAEMVPTAWLLTHRYRSKIFQNMSVPDILTDVLDRAGISGDAVRIGPFDGIHAAREYCVQYRETDYNFICRLMEEEGIWWYFEQGEENHALVMADSTSGYQPVEGEATLPFHPPGGFKVEDEHVFRFRRSHAVRPGAVVLRDYNFEKPALDLQVNADSGHDTGLEFSDYPGEYSDQSAGSDLAKLRAEEFECHRVLAIGQSNSARLTPARTFSLTEHPSDGLNGEYLVTAVVHEGRQAPTRAAGGPSGTTGLIDPRVHQAVVTARSDNNPNIKEVAEGLLQIAARLRRSDPTAHRALTDWVYHAGQVSRDLATIAGALGANPSDTLAVADLLEDPATGPDDDAAATYQCRFECIPSAVVYRPPRVTPWPTMRGTQTARVVGPEGEEIYTDKYGRVKVQFNWDRDGKFDDKSSCWIRVSQGMAGGQYGMMFLPRVGQEVIVDFLEGNPDNPIITGRVFNADNMPNYTLPDEKTKSVIETRSTPGGDGYNEIRFEDAKDKEQIFVHAQKDVDLRIENDEKDWIGRDKHEIIKGHQKKKIEKSDNRAVGGDQATSVGGNHGLDVTGSSQVKTGSHYTIETGGDIRLGGPTFKLVADGEGGLKASTLVLAANTITLKSGGNFITIDSGGVSIVGSPVNINSGGAAASVGASTPAALPKPAEPLEAATGDPGKDYAYQQDQPPPDPLEHAPLHNEAEATEEQKHWIGVTLYDDNGQPLVGERYEVVLTDGTKVARGHTDKEGKIYIQGLDPGDCQINFPDLDGKTWSPGPAPAEEGAGGGGGGGGGGGAPAGAPSVPSAPSV